MVPSRRTKNNPSWPWSRASGGALVEAAAQLIVWGRLEQPVVPRRHAGASEDGLRDEQAALQHEAQAGGQLTDVVRCLVPVFELRKGRRPAFRRDRGVCCELTVGSQNSTLFPWFLTVT